MSEKARLETVRALHADNARLRRVLWECLNAAERMTASADDAQARLITIAMRARTALFGDEGT